MKTMIEMHGREVEGFNNDNEQVSYRPAKNEKFILQVEILNGQFAIFHKVYILHIDKNGNEIGRFDAMSTSVTSIIWR